MQSILKRIIINLPLLVLVFLLKTNGSVVKANNVIQEDSLAYNLQNEHNTEKKYSLLMQLVKITRRYDLMKSILYGTQGEDLANKKDDLDWLSKFQLENGATHYYLGDYDEALEDYLNAIDGFKELNDNVGLVRGYNNTGMIYDRLENYIKAIEYYKEAIGFFNMLNEKETREYKRFLSQIYNNIASAYESLGKNKDAISYYESALQVAHEIGFRHIIGSIYNNLGKIEIFNKNYPQAKAYLDKAVEIRRTDGELEGLAKSYYFLSSYYTNINKVDSAEWAAKQSLMIAKDINLLEPQKISHLFLYEIYESKGLYKEALDQHKQYKLLSDSLINEQKVNQLSQLQISYEVEKIEEVNKLEKAKIKAFYTILIIVLSAILIVAILIVVLLKMQKKKVQLENAKLEIEVETKNRELTTNVMYLVQKNELLNNVAKKLICLKEKLADTNKKPLQQIIYNLQSQSDNEVWQEFELRFNQVHKDFYDQIRDRHPEITPSEERLCALLRLNMTSKEIAAITHQTVRGVEVARGRLRKRLELTGTDTNLITYLEGF